MIYVSPCGLIIFEDKGHICKVIAAMLSSTNPGLIPVYMELSSCRNQGQTLTAKGGNRILLFSWGKAKNIPGTARGSNGSQGEGRDRQG